MKKKIPIGISDFKEIISGDYYYIDKTLLINEILASGDKVLLFPRPRRFGKTLNISMLKYFFEKTKEDYSYLFENLAIKEAKENIAQYQNKYPVIFLTFKDVKTTNWEDIIMLLKKVISDEFARHKYLLDGDVLEKFEKKIFENIMTLEADLRDITGDSYNFTQLMGDFAKENGYAELLLLLQELTEG